MVEAFSDGVPRGACCVMLLRSVSGRPGAEGAPLLGWGALAAELCWRPMVLSVYEACEVGGAMRRDWRYVSIEVLIEIVMR
jgi:hypothetical protein